MLLIFLVLHQLTIKLLLEAIDFSLMLSAYISNHHLVVALAAILKQNLEYFPQTRKNAVFVAGVRHTFIDHLVETY